MRAPPPLSKIASYPIVGGIGILAAAVSLAVWSERVDVSPLKADPHIRDGQVWRLFTDIFPHGDFLHLAFNVYWLWVLGSLIEEAFGHVRTLALVVLLAMGSSAAEYALMYGGIGLSGVGYGLFGFLWVLSRRDGRFHGAMDANTVGLFVIWFFLCIALTVAGVWHVGNVAHGSGAVLGALVGLAVASARWRGLGVTAVGLLLLAAAAGVWARPFINLTSERAEELARLGYYDLLKGRDADALGHLRASVEVNDEEPHVWLNLGLAYRRTGNAGAARQAFR